jgi:hypothetical protein
MIPPWAYLDEHDRAAFRATVAFLEGRLADRATTEWALRLKLTNRIERIAIEQLLGSSKLDEPWLTAWRLVEESWSAGTIAEVNSTVIYDIRERLNAGDTSGAIVSTIVNLVAPRLKVEPIGGLRRQAAKISSRPRKFSDLLSAGLSSGDLVDLSVLKLDTIADLSFLQALANALEAAVNQGLAIGRRLGWDGHKRLWQLGGLDRAHYVKAVSHSGEAKDDPDVYHHGIAPSVKLLSEVVGRIANLKPAEVCRSCDAGG